MQTKVTRDNGRLKVDIAGKLYDPLSFKSFRPNPKNISEFYAAGCLKHPCVEHNLRHYTGALTDIRPAKTEFYF